MREGAPSSSTSSEATDPAQRYNPASTTVEALFTDDCCRLSLKCPRPKRLLQRRRRIEGGKARTRDHGLNGLVLESRRTNTVVTRQATRNSGGDCHLFTHGVES